MFTVSAPPPPITQYETPVSTSSQQLRPAIYTESPNDGIYITKKGKIIVGKNSPYEISGFSISEAEGNITFEIESNLPLKGLSEPRAKAKRIGYGDLFLYYPNTTAGIRFTGKKIGVYHQVKTVNNAKFHFGNKTTKDYIKRLKSAKAYARISHIKYDHEPQKPYRIWVLTGCLPWSKNDSVLLGFNLKSSSIRH